MSPTEIQYYRQRAIAERAQARSATPSQAALIHLELACMYEKIVELDQLPEIPLHLVEVTRSAA